MEIKKFQMNRKCDFAHLSKGKVLKFIVALNHCQNLDSVMFCFEWRAMPILADKDESI